MKSFIHIFAFLVTTIPPLTGQFRHENVFPATSGASLIQQLRDEFKTSVVLDYSVARDTLFSVVDRQKDSLECIYTGMRLPLPADIDPTEAVYLGGIPNGINTEHAYPQGKGAMGMAQSDMYNLYPSRIKTNSDRGDFPLGNIPDNTVRTWYLGTEERATPPSVNRDLWSELVTGKFEPRESVKGNLARSIFYFYTMYSDQANAADPAYFSSMMADLCQWHYDDPVDSLEWSRNEKISNYQGGFKNPFILDCSLVSRAYCNNIDQACEAVIQSGIGENTGPERAMSIFPNPGQDMFYVYLQEGQPSPVMLEVFNTAGIPVLSIQVGHPGGTGLVEIDLGSQTPGVYLVRATYRVGGGRAFARVIKQ